MGEDLVVPTATACMFSAWGLTPNQDNLALLYPGDHQARVSSE